MTRSCRRTLRRCTSSTSSPAAPWWWRRAWRAPSPRCRRRRTGHWRCPPADGSRSGPPGFYAGYSRGPIWWHRACTPPAGRTGPGSRRSGSPCPRCPASCSRGTAPHWRESRLSGRPPDPPGQCPGARTARRLCTPPSPGSPAPPWRRRHGPGPTGNARWNGP